MNRRKDTPDARVYFAKMMVLGIGGPQIAALLWPFKRDKSDSFWLTGLLVHIKFVAKTLAMSPAIGHYQHCDCFPK